MCRSIKVLREGATPAPDDEVRAAALQFVRKVSGYRTPAKHNAQAFDEAVDRVSQATAELLAAIAETHPQRVKAAVTPG